MDLEEMKSRAKTKVEADNPDATNFKLSKTYENFLGGTLFSISFSAPGGKEDSNHVYIRDKEMRVYRWHSDVLGTVANAKERNWFFRFLELAGVGGVIAFILLLLFGGLLCALAFSNVKVDPSILDIVKLSFTIILGYFFGSQSAQKRDA